MTFFQRFFRSKCCWALLIFVVLVGSIFFKLTMSYLFGESPENWQPYFTFFDSQECALDPQCYGKGRSVGYRSSVDPESFEEAFTIDQFYFPITGNTEESDALFIRIYASDWQCRESGSQALGEKFVEPDRQDPRKGFFYVCWPLKQLPILE